MEYLYCTPPGSDQRSGTRGCVPATCMRGRARTTGASWDSPAATLIILISTPLQ